MLVYEGAVHSYISRDIAVVRGSVRIYGTRVMDLGPDRYWMSLSTAS